MKSAAELAAWAEAAYQNGWVYWYGTCGYTCTEALLMRKARQYPGHYTDSRMAKYRRNIAEGKVCTDCIGLFKSFAWDQDGDIATRESVYASNGQPDHGARTALNKCRVKGDIASIPEIPGLAVWTKTGSHIGVYVGDGYVVEARGYVYDVERNKLDQRGFVTWGLYPYAEYTAEQIALAKTASQHATPVEPTPSTDTAYSLTTLRKGSRGTQVEVLQWLLNQQGYAAGKTDGIFGANTLAAVKAFQRANGLTADGIVGKNTWAKLLT